MITVLIIVIMLAIAGLVIDYGMATVQHVKLQKAADAAALAGVQDLPSSTQAQQSMVYFFRKNYDRYEDTSASYGASREDCWISVTDQIPTFFLSLFGWDTIPVEAKSKARLEVMNLSKGRGIMPFVLLNPSKNNDPSDDLAGNIGRPYILKYGPDSLMVDDWWLGEQQIDPMHEHDGNGGLDDGGWRSALALDPLSTDPHEDANSADDFRTNIIYGWDGYVRVGDILDSNPGVMTGAVVQGRNLRLGGDDTPYEVFTQSFMSANPHHPRIIVVPIVSLGEYRTNDDGDDVWHQATDAEILDEDYDWQNSRVDGFAAFYMLDEQQQRALPGGRDVDRRWIAGRYLGPANIGGGSSSSSDDGGDFGLRMGRLVPFESEN